MMREDDDIPVLTELAVSQPLTANGLNITPELLTEIVAHIKPQLTTQIENAMQNDLSQQIRQQVAAEISSVLDKARADWATEIPRLMQINADIIRSDLEKNLHALQQQIATEASQQLSALLPTLEQQFTQRLETITSEIETCSTEAAAEKIQAQLSVLREDILSAQQTALADDLAGVYRSLTQHTQGELTAYMDLLQKESLQAVQQKMDEAFPSLYESLAVQCTDRLKAELDELSQTARQEYLAGLKAEFPAVEQALNNKVHEILEQQLPLIESTITANVRAEVEKLVDSVRLVFGRTDD